MADKKKDAAAGEGNAADDDNNTGDTDLNQDADDAAGDDNGDDKTGADAQKTGDKKTGEGAKKQEKTFTESEYQKRLAKEKAKWEKEKDLPEIERLKKENAEFQQEKRENKIAADFSKFASDQKAKNVERLLKIYREDLEIADDGSIENLKEIFENAKTDFPEFFPPVDKGSADAGGGKEQTKLTYDQKVDAEFAKTGRTHAFKL